MGLQPRRALILSAALAVFAALGAGRAGAVFVAAEMDALDTEPLFDSEYFLDLRGFRRPLAWDRLWAAAPAGYRINAASLDRSELFLEQDLGLPKRLNDWLSFRFDLAHLGTKDLVELHHWIGLEFGGETGLTAELFGEPAFAKEDADIGLRLRYRHARRLTLLAGANAVDFNLNERGRSTQSYHRKPLTYELGAAWEEGGDRWLAGLELDAPLIRSVPVDGRVYRYRRTRARLEWRRFDDDRAYLASYAYEFKRENDRFDPDPGNSSIEFHRRVHRAELAAERDFGRDSVEGGAGFMTRGARADFPNAPAGDTRYKRWEVSPYARWRRAVSPYAVTEAALFFSTGENRRLLRGPSTAGSADGLIEAKLGTGVDFLYGKNGRIGLYGTWDLDDFTRHAWDGGAARLMIFF